MAVYRQVHTTFWNDPEVLEWTAEEKYFYLYLMTNPYTNQIGIYEISKKMMSIQLGYSIHTVSILLQTMIDRRKIDYSEDTREVYLLNWIKYNKSTSPKVTTLIDKELQTVKTSAFAIHYHTLCVDLGIKLKPLSIQYPYSIHTLPQKEQEQEEEKEEEKEQQQEEKEVVVVVDPARNIYNDYAQAGFGIASTVQAEKLAELEKTYGYDWTTDAIKEAALNNVLKISYVDGILKNWKANGRNAQKPQYKNGKEVKKDFTEREYDYDTLEKKLLGWE
ncbi:DnaD domain protein [Proteiniclasticum sp. BAD-10]|uniref:DnaD domain protein n=1 Tax=Proteiniclasticum sediminis TaxID=2804028 RepID=A0A941CQ10_9CLOT|nr:DnaD domain protein [Proteiniclasticum sediminis]MBR0576781.1 DnaD domain protein [Proteiniclasticum sediminis]